MYVSPSTGVRIMPRMAVVANHLSKQWTHSISRFLQGMIPDREGLLYRDGE
jgi:hypothetical protein